MEGEENSSEMKNLKEKIILHITSARGPAECELAVAKTLAELMTECKNRVFETEVLNRVLGQENGTLQSALLEIKGVNCRQTLKPWIGTIQWIQKSPYRPNHGRKNWFAAIFEVNETAEIQFKESDCIIQTLRSSGAGGQHVNKVSSAVRVTHTPTGVSVLVQDSRSQLQNRKIALERIQEKLTSVYKNEVANVASEQWMQQVEIQRGSPVKVFSGLNFKPKKEEKSFKKNRQVLKQQLRKDLEL